MKITLHPDYLSALSQWNTIDDFVDGSSSRTLKYLRQYSSEKGGSDGARRAWESRLERCENENECEPILNVLVSHLAQPLNFGAAGDDERMKALFADVTRRDVSAQMAFKQALDLYVRHGKLAILVDAPVFTGITRPEDRNPAFRSYQRLIRAQDILSWEWFDDGARIGQLKRVVISLGLFSDGKETFERAAVYEFEGDARDNLDQPFVKFEVKLPKDRKAEDGEMDCEELPGTRKAGKRTEIPIVIIGNGLADSSMRMPVQYSIKLLNHRSAKENVEYHQGFQRVIVVGERGDGLETFSEGTITFLPNEAASVQQIPPGDTSSLQATIAAIETKLRRHGMRQMNQIVSDGSAQVQSADSKALDMKGLIAWLETTLDLFERKLGVIYSIHADHEGFKEQVTVRIGRDFGLEDKQAEMQARGTVYSRAQQLGAFSVQQQVLLMDVSELRGIVPDEGDETGDKTRARLIDEIRGLKAPERLDASSFGSSFGGGKSDPLGDIP